MPNPSGSSCVGINPSLQAHLVLEESLLTIRPSIMLESSYAQLFGYRAVAQRICEPFSPSSSKDFHEKFLPKPLSGMARAESVSSGQDRDAPGVTTEEATCGRVIAKLPCVTNIDFSPRTTAPGTIHARRRPCPQHRTKDERPPATYIRTH